VKRISNFQFI